jgi:hypothetical protein
MLHLALLFQFVFHQIAAFEEFENRSVLNVGVLLVQPYVMRRASVSPTTGVRFEGLEYELFTTCVNRMEIFPDNVTIIVQVAVSIIARLLVDALGLPIARGSDAGAHQRGDRRGIRRHHCALQEAPQPAQLLIADLSLAIRYVVLFVYILSFLLPLTD